MAKITTITNPLTGQPAQVDQLDHTAQQIDDGLNIARNVSNPNLLDNWYFGNPVDQRGGYVVLNGSELYFDPELKNLAGTMAEPALAVVEKTSKYAKVINVIGNSYYAKVSDAVRGYVGSGYTIDRWHSNGYNGQPVLINADGLAAYPGVGFNQKFELSLVGKTITFSILDTSNYLEVFTFEYQSAFHEPQGQVYNLQFGDNVGILFYLRVDQTASRAVRGVKLELGSQQTLAHQDENGVWQLNEIPDYGEQLARCQTSQINLVKGSYSPIGIGWAESETSLLVVAPIPVTLRAIPSIIFTGSPLISGVGTTVTKMDYAGFGAGCCYIRMTCTGLTKGNFYNVDSGTLNTMLLLNSNL